MENNKYCAFTLAEILITVVVIGILAMMLLLVLVQTTNEREYKTGVKKADSRLNEALKIHNALQGKGAGDYLTAKDLVTELFKLRLVFADSYVTEFTSGDCAGGELFTTSDGMIFCIENYTSDGIDKEGSICDIFNTKPCSVNESVPNLWVDVNGVKGPNKLTTSPKRPKDVYQFQIYSQKVIPFGEATQDIVYDVSEDEDSDKKN